MRLVIIGGSAGGASVATRTRRALETASITLFERTPYVASAYCGLPYHLSGTIARRETLLPTEAGELARRHALDVRTRHEVLAIDRTARTVTVRDLERDLRLVQPYDKLVLATGAATRLPAIPGLDQPGVFGLRNLPDLDRIMAWANTQPIRHATVVGGGFIGLELVENLVQRGYAVSLIEAGTQLMPALDREIARVALDRVLAHGVDVQLNNALVAITRTARLHAALANGETLDTDLVLVVPGVQPDHALARAAGLALGRRGGVRVDAQLRTSDEHIYALGDAIEASCALTGEPSWVPLAAPLNRQARVIAAQLAGENARYSGTLGTFVCKIFDLTVAATGLNEQRLRAGALPYEQVLIPTAHHVGFYPGAETIFLKLLFDPRDGRLLGAQAAGGAGVDKRIDVLATALAAGMTVHDLADLELAYAPPYGAPRDPVNLAGAVAAHARRGTVRGRHPGTLATTGRQEAFVLDVRTREEHEFGAIPGAVNIPAETLRERLHEIPKDRPVLVSCQIGAKAHSVTRLLVQRGYDAYNLIGGYRAWRLFHEPPAAPVLLRRAPVDAAAPAEAAELDTRGLSCPGPIMRVRKQMERLDGGTLLRIHASDPSFPTDFRLWCKKTGHDIVEESGRPGDYTVVCRKH
jgi:NADPH-dependent 2,4-dienoyl-CoA reductase/sulfur reductase-like enzyme/rhodanese-related sulfurtransferase/TusA-related sulfurtransferase